MKSIKGSAKKAKILNVPSAERKNPQKESVLAPAAEEGVTGLQVPVHAEAAEAIAADLAEHN